MKTMRRALLIGLALGACLAAALAAPGQRVLLNGKEVQLDQPVLRLGEVLLIWVRDAERVDLGTVEPASTAIRGAAHEVRLSRGQVEIAFQPGSDLARVNGATKRMPAPATLVAGRMMVPVQFLCQAFGVSLRIGRTVVLSEPGRGSAWVRQGTIAGRVTYAGAPAAGVRVRLARSDNAFVPGAAAVTDPDGWYRFEHVPNGDYHAFVYVGDNPEFFNRRSAALQMETAAPLQAEEIRMGRVLRPVRPLPGSRVRAQGGSVRLEWSPCPQAAAYRVTVKRASDGAILFSATASGPACEVPQDKLAAGQRAIWTVAATDAGGQFLGGSPGAGGTAWAFTLRAP